MCVLMEYLIPKYFFLEIAILPFNPKKLTFRYYRARAAMCPLETFDNRENRYNFLLFQHDLYKDNQLHDC